MICFSFSRFLLLISFCIIVSCSHRFHDDLSEQEWTEVQNILQSVDVQGPVDCEICKQVIKLFDDALQTNTSITLLDEVAFQICLRLEIPGWTPVVCHGTIREFGSEVIHVFSERFLDPQTVCAKLNFCSPKRVESDPVLSSSKRTVPATLTREWQKMMEDTLIMIKQEQESVKYLKFTKPQNVGTTGTFIHISDIHVDARYSPGSNALCPRPLCCRRNGEIPLNQTAFRAAGQWGDYNCDTPVPLLENLWETFANLPEKPDFIVYTGDNSAHDIWAQTQNLQQERSVRLFENIQAKLPGWQMYPTLGNHESYPVDQFSEPPEMSWLYGSLAKTWTPWLSTAALSTFQYAGYYTTQVAPGLRLISLNTMYCDANNFWLLLDWQDPAGQIAWLNATLQAARDGNEKVWIIGHIPFNSGGCLDSYEFPLWSLVDTYKDTISNLFFGHSHRDSFIVFKDFATNTKPIAVGYIAPSVTPYTNKNNAFRVYQYDRETFEILNYNQYILNLTEANESGLPPRWFIEYNPIDAYKMQSLSPQQWFEVADVKFRYDQQMLDTFTYYNGCSFGDKQVCDEACRNSTICDLLASTNAVSNQCQGISGDGLSLSTFMNHFCPAWWNE